VSIRFRFHLARGGYDLKVEAELPGQGVTALFGRSGCGKTSLLRCIAGLEQPDDAYLKIGSDVWHDSSEGVFVPPNERAIGYVFQEGVLFPHLDVAANLRYGDQRTPEQMRTQSFDEVVALLGLEALLARQPVQLSGGEKQRVAIGRALLNHPRLLLMDEPLASLDRGHKKEILPYLERLHRNSQIPILYVTHDSNELVRIADHLVLVDEGRLLAQGPLEEVLARIDLPISRDDDAGAVINAGVLHHDEEFYLTQLEFAGGKLWVSWVDLPVGSPIRIRIHAKDVSLALDPPGPTSILNILPAKVDELQTHGRGRVVIKLDVGGVPILARVTQRSQQRLGIAPGKMIYAQIKGVALLA